MAQLSLTWLLYQDPVDAPIVGTTSVDAVRYEPLSASEGT
jgi:aryl-alcohol dehydrogenase-like predicted oxidoreductase